MYTTIVAALKAVPEIVAIFNQFVKMYHELHIRQIETKMADIRKEVSDVCNEIENGHHTTEERRALARRLSNAVKR